MKTVNRNLKSVFIMAAATVFIFITVFIVRLYNFCRINVRYDLTFSEYNSVCSEWCLDPDKAKIEYIYSSGRDLYGVRLLIDDCEYETISGIFTVEFEKSDSGKSSAGYSYKTRFGEDVKAVHLPFELPQLQNYYAEFYDIFVFEADSNYYIEIEKAHSVNANMYYTTLCFNLYSLKNQGIQN